MSWSERYEEFEKVKMLVNQMSPDEPGALLLKLMVIIAETLFCDIPKEPVQITTRCYGDNE